MSGTLADLPKWFNWKNRLWKNRLRRGARLLWWLIAARNWITPSEKAELGTISNTVSNNHPQAIPPASPRGDDGSGAKSPVGI